MIRLPFLIILITYFLVVACHSSDQKRIYQENLSLQNEAMLDFMEMEYEELKKKTKKALNNPAKYEYLPILASLEKVELEVDKILNQLDSVKTELSQKRQVNQQIEYFSKIADSSLNEITNIHFDLLDQHGEKPIGLKKGEIGDFISKFENKTKATLDDWKVNNLAILSSPYSKQAIANLDWKVRLMNYELYQYFVSFSGGRSTAADWYYYPVVNPRKCIVRTDEIFEAEVSIGTYASIDPKYFKLFVNGDSVTVNDDGITNLRISSANKIGVQNLRLEAIIHNPDNGRSYSIDGTFEYEVIEK